MDELMKSNHGQAILSYLARVTSNRNENDG